MKEITAGVVAHVDAGKTTLSEAMLYNSGALRTLGRVDNGDAFLDPDRLEKKRGITIFSHQASLETGNTKLTLLDTPGHMDFASQTEQVLSVLDYAVLVISAVDGIQGYTRTLWNLLDRYSVPTFIFINKIDAATTEISNVMEELQSGLSQGCVLFDEFNADVYEEIAMQDDDALSQFLNDETLSDESIQKLINERKIFPCFSGSALKNSGINEFLAGFDKWTVEPNTSQSFGAKIFKISHDQGERLTWVRVTGGTIKTKAELFENEKVNQIRIYNGAKFQTVDELLPNQVGALTGLTSSHPGMGLGNQSSQAKPVIQPVLNYDLDPLDNDIHTCLTALRELEDEDPQLHVQWSNQLQQISIQIMGEIQLEIIQQLMLERFNLNVSFGQGKILYQETINESVEGVGHFEPLRHYAEVHLLMRPGEPGSGISINSDCSLDVLSSNWQHQVLSNLTSKVHLGVLVGAPLTDVKITLINGRGSNVHSVGGDFREATWRAVRQGLMMLKEKGADRLLEPWYRFKLVVNQTEVGRALNDIQKMSGEFDPPQNSELSDMVILTGVAPVSEMRDYAQDVRSYTHGQGQLECIPDGFKPCHNADDVIEKINYQPVSDLENTPDSVFCAHGAGYPVAWDDVPKMAHVPYATNL
ncbi:elongation factor G [Companilactobacillus sp.]|uniref:elongation factor G n=1 Tax=Companilactobacillus sp. TaxID=2767905 RepID=UPI0025C1E98C|nr:TetM/TetW/TetO/TetS family tetracycline resistance ribosomal protection protein [Companilactobacillus sp.]MCH4008178.1 TetM/TetW/TetO/TetS family tetracycline resistance ribosomal protection protein [Companilactobacillus sp.]MCH4051643.1 TetM/TetW/TetO/TetS family tetracycline resistance ribosomal protection protein [Companilactobacillus sp.]MCH4076121.1 TetM/TetW/TetO/TetS family tetracycline resistance ribosomal protection protein [Companilactobacillus sp.]MCH4124696.1 TetM/TetW/TetO/TetS 